MRVFTNTHMNKTHKRTDKHQTIQKTTQKTKRCKSASINSFLLGLESVSPLLEQSFAVAVLLGTGQFPSRWRESFNRMVLKVNPLRRHPSIQANPILQSFTTALGGRGARGGGRAVPRLLYCGHNAETQGRSTLQPDGNGAA